MRSMTTAGMLAALVCAAPVFGADANAGKAVFRAQCALCHSAEPGDNGGAQGPNLNGVFGRHSAGNPEFGYTAALKASGLTWNSATLDRFLTAPTSVVPGSAMVIPVPDNTERSNLIAYFQAVKDGTFKATTPSFAGPGGGRTAPCRAQLGQAGQGLRRLEKRRSRSGPPRETCETSAAVRYPVLGQVSEVRTEACRC
ncbi:MAG: c-type cytochrome [Steroidobacteraceae bacterium]